MTPLLFLIPVLLIASVTSNSSIDKNRHNAQFEFDKSQHLVEYQEASSICNTVEADGYIGSTYDLQAHFHLVGTTSREEVTRTMIAAMDWCGGESRSGITGFHFGPIESWCDPTLQTVCRPAMTVSIYGDHSDSITALFAHVLHELSNVSPVASTVSFVQSQRRTNGISWGMAMAIVLFVSVVSLSVVYMVVVVPTSCTSGRIPHQLDIKQEDETTTTNSDNDHYTVATQSTHHTDTSTSSNSSIYLVDARSTLLSSGQQRDTIIPLTEQQRLVDWLVPIHSSQSSSSLPQQQP